MDKKFWIYLSFFVAFITSVSVITMKYLTNSKCNITTLLYITYLFIGLLSFLYLPFDKIIINDIKKNFTKKDLYIIVFYCFVLVINRLSQLYLFKKTPNVGISHLIINTNVVFTLFISYILFKQNINYKSLVGVIIIIIGLIITIYYSNN